MTLVLVDKLVRKGLVEGRNYGIGHGFCKREGDVVTTIMPITACKDFLNDVVYSERSGKDHFIYGFYTKKLGIFVGPYAHLAMNVCKMGTNPEVAYETYDKEVNELDKNYLNIQQAIQRIEVELTTKNPIEGLTTIYPAQDHKFICEIPIWWTGATFLISLWGLCIRNLVDYSGGCPIEHLEKNQGLDAYNLKAAIPKLRYIIANGAPRQDMTHLKPHYAGIVGCSIP